MAEKCRARHERLLVICADPLDAVRLGQEIPWFSTELGVRSLPDWETLPYDVLSPQEDIVSERLETLYRMTSGTKGLDVVIASAVTAAQRMRPSPTWAQTPSSSVPATRSRSRAFARTSPPQVRRRQAGTRGG